MHQIGNDSQIELESNLSTACNIGGRAINILSTVRSPYEEMGGGWGASPAVLGS